MTLGDRRHSLASTRALLLCAGLLSAGRASAQFPADQPTRLPALGRSAVSDDDSTSLVVNPANLGFMPGAELRWTGMFMNEGSTATYQGHAFALAFPIPFLSLATGLRLDLVSPPNAAAEQLFGTQKANYEWLTWGLALRPSNAFSLGFSYQHSYSNQTAAHGLSSWSLGATSRPSDYFGFAVVGHNLNAPTTGAGGFVDRSYNFAVAVRPLRSRALEVLRLLRVELGGAIPIIGVGGLMSADDVRARLAAGANLVQLYTGFVYRGPALLQECLRDLH